MRKVEVKNVTGLENELEEAFLIRRKVFVEEQNCPPELEWEFEEESTHFLATVDNIPAGACRWRKTGKGYKLERFAVLKEFRGMEVAQAMVRAVLNDLPSGADYVYLNAQLNVINLYKKFGFVTEGSHFEEAGILHSKMVLKLPEN